MGGASLYFGFLIGLTIVQPSRPERVPMMWNRCKLTRRLLTSHRWAERGRNARSSAFRVRGHLRESELRKRAPPPGPLNGGWIFRTSIMYLGDRNGKHPISVATAGRGSRRDRKPG